MADLMNKVEYQKACSYRVQEALESILSQWDDHEPVDGAFIEQTQHLLEEVQIELNYFREKLETGAE